MITTARELADEVVRAAQLKYINQPRSESDERAANAIARLAESMSALDEVVVCTSSIVFIKTGGRLVARVLTEAEIRTIQANPQLMRNPAGAAASPIHGSGRTDRTGTGGRTR